MHFLLDQSANCNMLCSSNKCHSNRLCMTFPFLIQEKHYEDIHGMVTACASLLTSAYYWQYQTRSALVISCSSMLQYYIMRNTVVFSSSCIKLSAFVVSCSSVYLCRILASFPSNGIYSRSAYGASASRG